MNVIWELAQPFIGEVIVTLVVLGGLLGLWKKGKNDQRRDDELKRARADAEAHQQRREIDADVAKEPDLVDRAHRAGVVRGKRKPK